MYGTVRTVVWADGRGNPPSDPIPYMHQGQFESLEEVITYYSTFSGALDRGHHVEQVIMPLDLSEEQIRAVAAFLRSLSDPSVAASAKTPRPSDGLPRIDVR